MGKFIDPPTKSYKPKGKFVDNKPTFGFAGPLEYGATKENAEDVFPIAGQTAGSVFGFPGSVAGATAGQALRQTVRGVKGKGFDLKSIPVEAAKTATVEGVMRGLGKVTEPARKAISNRMMGFAVKAGKKVLEKYPNLGSDILEEGIYGTRGQMIKKSGKIISEGETGLQKLLGSRPEKVNLKNVIDDLSEMKRRASNIGDTNTLEQIDKFEKFIMGKGKNGLIDLGEANQLKRDLYNKINDPSFYKNVNDLSGSAEMYRRTAKGLRKEIVGAVPEAGKIDKSMSIAIKAKKALMAEEAGGLRKAVLPFFEVGGAGTALAFGHPGIAGLIVGRRVLNTPLAQSTLAKALMSRLLGRGVTIGSSELARRQ